MAKIRVLLVDDHALLRDGVRMLLDNQPDMEVVGEAGSCLEAVDRARETIPDVVALDLSMPGGSGIAAIDGLRREVPQARVLVLTMHDDPSCLRAALTAGALGYVVKTSPSAGLLSAIRAVYQGGAYVDSGLAGSLVNGGPGASPAGGRQGTSASPTPLSARETEVLARLAQRHTNQQVAEQLFLSTRTVEAHRARIYQKLGLKSRADLVRYALDADLLRPP